MAEIQEVISKGRSYQGLIFTTFGNQVQNLGEQT